MSFHISEDGIEGTGDAPTGSTGEVAGGGGVADGSTPAATDSAPAHAGIADGSAGDVQASDGGGASGAAGAEPASDIDLDAWNGELDTIHKSPWWNQVPESVRPALANGIRKKFSAFHKGYNQKSATLRGELTAEYTAKINEANGRFAEAEAMQRRIEALIAANDDPDGNLKRLSQELEKTKTAHEAEMTSAKEALVKEWQEKEKQWQTEHGQTKERLTAAEGRLEHIAQEELELGTATAVDFLQDKAPHILQNDDALRMFAQLCEMPNPPQAYRKIEGVIKAVMAHYPAPEPKPEVTPEAPSLGQSTMSLTNPRAATNADGAKWRQGRTMREIMDGYADEKGYRG